MKHKLLTFAVLAILPLLNMQADEPVLHVSENFSTQAWQDALSTNDPAYVKPAPGGNYGVLTTALYQDKYKMEGAFVTLQLDNDNPTLDCALFAEKSIVHTDENGHAISFRLRKSGTSYFEMQELPNAGVITIHARNGNKTATTTMKLQKYEMEAWTDIHTFDLRMSNDFRNTFLDEILTFNINSPDPIKLRLSRGDKFIMLFQVDVAAYAPTAVKNLQYAGFNVNGRTLIAENPTQVSIYNMLGKVVHEVYVENTVELPASVGKGLYIVKGNQGVQKIQIK